MVGKGLNLMVKKILFIRDCLLILHQGNELFLSHVSLFFLDVHKQFP